VTYVGKEDALRLQDDSLFIAMTVIQEVFKTQELDGTHLLRVFPHNRDHQLTRLQQQITSHFNSCTATTTTFRFLCNSHFFTVHRGANYCYEHVCVSVRLACLKNNMSKMPNKIFHTGYAWPWLGPHLMTMHCCVLLVLLMMLRLPTMGHRKIPHFRRSLISFNNSTNILMPLKRQLIALQLCR